MARESGPSSWIEPSATSEEKHHLDGPPLQAMTGFGA